MNPQSTLSQNRQSIQTVHNNRWKIPHNFLGFAEFKRAGLPYVRGTSECYFLNFLEFFFRTIRLLPISEPPNMSQCTELVDGGAASVSDLSCFGCHGLVDWFFVTRRGFWH
jgi:hypothetical protein